MLNSDHFLADFNKIERYLRQTTKKGKGAGFYQLVDVAAKTVPAIRRFKDDLKEYADLRNAIVHERTDGHVIAEPNDRAVTHIKHIASIVLHPPKVIPSFQTEVHKLSTSEPIEKAVKVMFEKDFSQIPIYDGSRFIGLLTANTVARWLGASVADEIFSVTETTIQEVLGYFENRTTDFTD
jgi:hypothetical protein